MNGIVRTCVNGTFRFFMRPYCRRLIYLCLLGIPVLFEFLSGGFVRRTFVFYNRDTGEAEVEERMLPRMPSRELDIRQYVEETLLGPVSAGAEPLFSRETGLRSLLFREGIVYADLSPSAALPYSGGESAFRSLYILNTGMRRNFDFIKEVHLFIEGKEAYLERFRAIPLTRPETGNFGKSLFSVKTTNIISKNQECA
jgi:hypothetical protein